MFPNHRYFKSPGGFMKKLFSALLLLVCSLTLISCTRRYESKSDYFDGNVLVEYNQTTQNGVDDSLVFTFNEKGDYTVSFSYTKGYEDNAYNKGQHTLPEDFTITVTDDTKTKVISQYVLPGFLTVTITHNDVTESHDFQ